MLFPVFRFSKASLYAFYEIYAILTAPVYVFLRCSFRIRCGYMAGNRSTESFQNTKWPAVRYSLKISQNRKVPANPNYHMSI